MTPYGILSAKLTARRLRYIGYLLLVIGYLFFSFSPIVAATPFETAQQDYTFQYTKLRDAYDKHISTLKGYQNFKTATSKEQAFVNSKAYVEQACQLYLAYSSLLREYSNGVVWDSQQEKYDGVISKLDAIDKYFTESRKNAQEAKTLEEVAQLSSQLKEKLSKELDSDLNIVHANFDFISTSNLFDEFKRLAVSLGGGKINASSIFSNWQSEISDIETKTDKSLKDADNALKQYKSRKMSDSELDNVKKHTNAARSQLGRSKSLFGEAVKLFN